MKSLKCRDVGINCDYVARGNTSDDVMKQAIEHGKSVHGYQDKDFTPEFQGKVKGAIKDERA